MDLVSTKRLLETFYWITKLLNFQNIYQTNSFFTSHDIIDGSTQHLLKDNLIWNQNFKP